MDMYEILRPIHSKLWTADGKLCSLKHKLAIFGGHLEYANKPNLHMFRENLSRDIYENFRPLQSKLWTADSYICWSGLVWRHNTSRHNALLDLHLNLPGDTSSCCLEHKLAILAAILNMQMCQIKITSWDTPTEIWKHGTPMIKTVVYRVFTRCWLTHSLMHSLTNIMQV